MKNFLKVQVIKFSEKKVNSPISLEELEFIIENLPVNKTPGPDGFGCESYHLFKKEIIPILQYFSENIVPYVWNTSPKHLFYETIIVLIPYSNIKT